MVNSDRLAAARSGDQEAFRELIEPYRRELQVHCYRILGSLQDAEDLVQDTLLRAWRRLETYEGRASFRAWLYKIATNACLDALDKRPRRALPNTLSPPSDPDAPFEPPTAEAIWLEPLPEEWLTDAAFNPEARYVAHESITLAFLAALQLLPPRQRAVLILRDVLNWHADEVADLLGLTVSAVNSALHRARSTLGKHYVPTSATAPNDTAIQTLLDRYVQAWENADVTTLVALLKEDAVFSMPPTPGWFRGRANIAAFFKSAVFAGAVRGRILPIRANGQAAFAVYYPDENGCHAFGIQVVEIADGQVANITVFLDTALFLRFGLPIELPN